MKKTDRRVVRTKRMLREALLDLVTEKGFNAISIRDITERADVAYATFFRHYESKEALLAEQIEMLIKEFEEMAHISAPDSPVEAEGILLFKHIGSKKVLYRKLLSNHNCQPVVNRLKEVISSHTRPYLEPFYDQGKQPLIPLEIAINHIAASTLELVIWWIGHNPLLPPEQMANIYRLLVIDTTLNAIAYKDAY